jgi:hypothetical protein
MANMIATTAGKKPDPMLETASVFTLSEPMNRAIEKRNRTMPDTRSQYFLFTHAS